MMAWLRRMTMCKEQSRLHQGWGREMGHSDKVFLKALAPTGRASSNLPGGPLFSMTSPLEGEVGARFGAPGEGGCGRVNAVSVTVRERKEPPPPRGLAR